MAKPSSSQPPSDFGLSKVTAMDAQPFRPRKLEKQYVQTLKTKTRGLAYAVSLTPDLFCGLYIMYVLW